MRLTLPLSHYILCAETLISDIQIETAFGELLDSTGSIHAQVSNGHQIQVSVSEFSAATDMFEGWWRKAMQAWSDQAQPGEIFRFPVEFGSPPYGILIPSTGDRQNKVELYDRLEDALI